MIVLKDSSELIRYNNPNIPLYVQHGNLTIFPNMSAMVHWHEDVEFLIPLDGYLTFRVNAKDYVVHTGEAVFVNSRQMHFGYSSDGTDCSYISMVFKTSLLASNPQLYRNYIAPVTESDRLESLLLRPDSPSGARILTALHRVDRLYQQKKDCYELHAINSLLEMWISLYELTKTDHSLMASDSEPPADTIAQKQMVQFIQEHFTEKVSLAAIAASGNTSRTKCFQLFRKYLNQTPNDYLNEYRLEQSMNLLRATSLSTTEIALTCGFNSSSYFAEIFKKQKGCSPSEFRKL